MKYLFLLLSTVTFAQNTYQEQLDQLEQETRIRMMQQQMFQNNMNAASQSLQRAGEDMNKIFDPLGNRQPRNIQQIPMPTLMIQTQPVQTNCTTDQYGRTNCQSY